MSKLHLLLDALYWLGHVLLFLGAYMHQYTGCAKRGWLGWPEKLAWFELCWASRFQRQQVAVRLLSLGAVLVQGVMVMDTLLNKFYY